jgi:hypothetical protein
MRWVRSRQQVGAWCALFALTVQLVLSFGHVHVTGTGTGSARTAGTILADNAAPAPDAPAVPAKQKLPKLADDFCAICSLMNLASSVLPATAPGLPLPLLATKVQITTRLEIARAAPPSIVFQARAPPQA